MNWNKYLILQKFFFCIALLIFSFCILSCGIEELIYLEAVENSYVTSVTNGYVILPDNDSNGYFRYYMIYYCIYTSNKVTTNITPSILEDLRSINPNLESDYIYFNSYITNENSSPSSTMETIFESRRYYPLYASIDDANPVGGIAMYTLLSPLGYPPFPGASNGLRLIFDFTSPSSAPFMTIGNNPAKLYLFRPPNKFTVLPNDRSFILTTDLISNVNNNTNMDVKVLNNATDLCAYVSLYIIACGINNNFSSVYSRPRHMGIFRLPQK